MRKIFVVVERRADYSRYKPILEKLREDPFFEIHLVVTGICLLEEHGNDVNYIEADKFKISARIPMFDEVKQDSGAGMIKAMARVMGGLVDELEKAKPDLVLSGFDIGGNFAVTIAAAHMNIPVAHIQGGEVTGSIDESIRHAMSKFSHIHFPATEDAKKRLIRLGEDPNNIQKGNSMYDFFSQKAVANVLSKKSIPYLDRSYLDKKRLLREYSIKDEIRDFVTTIADEIIIYNDDRDFCYPKPIPTEYSKDISDKYQEVFEKISTSATPPPRQRKTAHRFTPYDHSAD